MSDNKQVSKINPEKHLSLVASMFKQVRLVWLLFTDKRVSLWIKSVLPLSLLYFIWPIDFIPDVVLGFGQLDDIGVILLGMALFVKLCPPELVNYYLNQIEFGGDSDDDEREIVDASYKIVDED